MYSFSVIIWRKKWSRVWLKFRKFLLDFMIWYICQLQLGCHTVAVVQYTFTHKQYIEQHIKFGRVWAMPRLCELYPGICLTTDEKTQKNLSESWSNCCVQTYKFQSFFKWIKFWNKNFHNLVFILRMNMLFIHNYRLQNSSRKKKDRNLRVWTQHNIKLYLVTYCT